MLNFNEVNVIRGKNLVGKASKEDVFKLCELIDFFEEEFDKLDCDDVFGTEGWRHYFGFED
jgi:hypothetical protein